MTTYSRVKLSGSTDGQGISVTGLTPSGGTVLHTAVTGAADSWDEIWLYAYNNATANRELGIAWGATAVGSRFVYTITGGPGGLVLVAPGLILRNTKVVKGYVTIADAISIFGYVNRAAT